MKNVLYIGNALSSSGKTKTTIETLSEHLKEICSVKVASNKSNKILRLLDMIRLIILNRSRTDFVLIDTYSTVNFYYAVVVSQLCRLFRLKYMPILHGGNLEIRLKNNPKLSSLVFNNAHKLIAPSKFLKSVFFNYGYNDVLHIPNTIKIDNYEFLNRKIDTIKLLWVRSFSSIYNPSLAVEILKSLIEKGYKAELAMVGPDVDGSFKSVKDLAEQYSLKVNFTGKLSKSKWIELSKDYNVFINTTNYDNTPVSLIEAMALGLPIVSTDVGGLPFLISNREDALLVLPNNVNAMVNAIIELVDNDMMRKKLINNSRTKAETFDWNVVKSKWEALLS